MPSFCRHNRLVQNCTICSREQNVQMRPIVSGGSAAQERHPAPRTDEQALAQRAQRPAKRVAAQGLSSARQGSGGVRVRRLARGADDGFHSPLVPGLRSSEDARRLAEEIALAATRLDAISDAPDGVWHELADTGVDLEERSWLAFLTAYIGPLESEEPFALITAARCSWSSGADPDWSVAQAGPRGAFDAQRAPETLEAYRAWVQRSGSQQAAYTGEPTWSAERRFARIYERLALPGLTRDARFELLVLLGRSGAYELRAGALQLGGENEATWAAKRALGIGDPLLLERRAAELASACDVELEALDLAFDSWGSGRRLREGLATGVEPEPEVLQRALAALRL